MNLLDEAGLTEARIRAALSARAPQNQDAAPDGLVPASVLIGLYRENSDGWQVIFTHRTERVERHKGQVSFPGGAAECVDRDVIDTALREAFEEIGLPRSCVTVLGCMGRMATVTGFSITPVVASLCWPFEVCPAEAEVERVFSVPLAWLANPVNYEERPYTRSNGSQEMVVFYRPYDGEVIWGATARMLADFIQTLRMEL